MRLVVIGGNSRGVGKTSLVAGIIASSRELRWTALKITQYGHGVCSSSGEECGCVVEDPNCPFAITRETDPAVRSDTSRFLRAGAEEVYWVRTRTGHLGEAMPELRRLLEDRGFVIMESNSILRFLRPDLYLPIVRFDVDDFKASSRLYWERADAYVVVNSKVKQPPWEQMSLEAYRRRPVFSVDPPRYCSPEIVSFLQSKLGVNAARRSPGSH